jgi:hypothetical protein
MTSKVKLGKEIVWKKGLNPSNHLPITVMMGFKQRKKGLNLLVYQMGLNPMFIPWFGMDDKPMESAKKF